MNNNLPRECSTAVKLYVVLLIKDCYEKLSDSGFCVIDDNGRNEKKYEHCVCGEQSIKTKGAFCKIFGAAAGHFI